MSMIMYAAMLLLLPGLTRALWLQLKRRRDGKEGRDLLRRANLNPYQIDFLKYLAQTAEYHKTLALGGEWESLHKAFMLYSEQAARSGEPLLTPTEFLALRIQEIERLREVGFTALSQKKIENLLPHEAKAHGDQRLAWERKAMRKANQVGPWLRMIGAILPAGDEWRIEEMMNHRNELRAERGRVPLFHYVRLFVSALEIRWEAQLHPQRRVD